MTVQITHANTVEEAQAIERILERYPSSIPTVTRREIVTRLIVEGKNEEWVGDYIQWQYRGCTFLAQ